MANRTDPSAPTAHGIDPQRLLDAHTRDRIYASAYWREECFGLSVAGVAARAAGLTSMGGSVDGGGGIPAPTPFLCLTLKLLQLGADVDTLRLFLDQRHFKYATALGAFYARLAAPPTLVYGLLEPLLADYRRLRIRGRGGGAAAPVTLVPMDVWVDGLLRDEDALGVKLPRLPRRGVLVETGQLGGRVTALDDAELVAWLQRPLGVEGGAGGEGAGGEMGLGLGGGERSRRQPQRQRPWRGGTT
ncbi:hypothetical protein BU14_0438s0001 [Porphyra umbilicalis]|uniref:Pre-mRNA-splicing factor 38 n=1 Tax=Porphyra umbilicalis TaxID=2786 RepID=A0A1X6NV66_PORUM|nr:hypothetical protein BU14_0438s0001 [Porphyra umbilicalis]|eukprot:OSX72406.1 hypothetical protein BU14_0438s0001 [Porphyra umbilicalis]